jgi:hypothetical protein
MDNATDQFVHNLNVKNYSTRLLTAQGAVQRAILLRLLAEELNNARQKGWQSAPGSLETRRLHGLD